MRQRDMPRLLTLVERLTRAQRRELLEKLKAQARATEAIGLVESAGDSRDCRPACVEAA